MIIDDDDLMGETLQDIFQEEGYNVATASNGREAINKVEQMVFDVVIIDIKLPDMDGIALLRKFKKVYTEMICIIITGYSNLQNAISALKDGADGYFVKPLIFDDLLHRIHQELEKQHLRRELKESEEKYRDAFNQANFYKDLLAHDIGNILNNIKSIIDVNRMWEGKEEKRKNRGDIMKLIKGQVDRGASLINNVRRLTEVEKSEIILESVNVKALLKDVIKPICGQFDKKKANLNIEKTQDTFNVKGGDFLIDVFDNIIRNGVIHNDNEQIELNIKLLKIQKEGENFIKLEFLDNGRGISDLRKKSIFDRGTQQNRRSGGLGIGLSLVKKIIGLYGGQIWVEDRIPGDYSKGSNFIVLLKEAK